MRILLISRCPPYPIHLGDRLIIWHLARELHARGHEIDLIAFTQYDGDNRGKSNYQAYFRQITLLPEPERSQGSYLKRLLWPPARFPDNAAASWSPQMWQTIETHLQQGDYDLVHVFGGVQVYEFAALLANHPALITPYESFSLYMQRLVDTEGDFHYQIQHIVAQQFERWMFKPYQRVVVLADPDRDELQRLNPDLPVEVIQNGIDLDYFKGGNPVNERDPHTLLFVGNYEYPPNVDAALYLAQKIFPQVQQQIPDVRLQLVGNAPPEKLQALASEAIEITGRVPDVRPYLAEATVFVCPLRMGAGIKNKVLEALAMQIPTAATPISIDGISVTDGKQVLVAEPYYLAGKVVHLLEHRENQARLAENGRALIESRYSWQHVADQYEALYEVVQREKTD